MSESGSDPTNRFSDRVENYVRYRPGYPSEVLELLKREIGLKPAWNVADLGSGTGISAELFLRNGNTVYGVEPNAPMREAAERLLAGYPNFHSVAGAAEATALPDRCVDVVVAAQAFHWFDAAKARQESLRILKPGGWAVLLWNTRRLDTTPLLRAYEQLLLDYGTDYANVRHDRIDPAKLATYFGGLYETTAVVNDQRLTLDGLRGRILSSSYMPAAGQPGHDAVLQQIERMFDEHQQHGQVTLEYDVEIHYRRLADE
ncbi:MAG: class I SAM-dependent methyltransferase [Pirellulales bacterium]|nr:class I SAM-dependent methyltransferase [Pirellulales bacterium]